MQAAPPVPQARGFGVVQPIGKLGAHTELVGEVVGHGVGEQRAQQITTEAANRGTRMHAYLEQYVLAGDMKPLPTNPYAHPSWFMAAEVILNGLQHVDEFWGVEVPLYYPGLYAGTSDGCGLHLNEESILDYKQTNKPKKEEWIEDYKVQLVAYIMAHNEVYGTDIKEGHVFMCSRDLQYQQFDLWPSDFNKYQDLWLSKVEEYYTTGLQGMKQLLTG